MKNIILALLAAVLFILLIQAIPGAIDHEMKTEKSTPAPMGLSESQREEVMSRLDKDLTGMVERDWRRRKVVK
jgi:hypothetical protein